MISTEFLGDRCLASQACRGDSTLLSGRLAQPSPALNISIKLINSFTPAHRRWWRWFVVYRIVHNLILLGIICKNKYRVISGRASQGEPGSSLMLSVSGGGGRMVEQVDDQGGGSHLTIAHSSDHHRDQEDKITKTDHENVAPRMPSRVSPSDNLPACSNCDCKSSQHKEMEDVPVSHSQPQPSEIFPQCMSQGSSSISILCEVLSWRRTARDRTVRTRHHQSSHCLSFKYLPILLSLGSGYLSVVLSVVPHHHTTTPALPY